MLWSEVIARTGSFLAAKGVDSPSLAAELLAARLLGVKRGDVRRHSGEAAAEPKLEAMRRAMKRLSSGEPLQYVLGEWDFRTLTLKCDRRALIPRPETEDLVTKALAVLGRSSSARPVVADVGTGTGAIIFSIASEYKGDGVFIGTDVSAEALSLAKENAERLSLSQRVSLMEMDGLDGFDEPEIFDLIVSNPPYIATGSIASLDRNVRDFEPRIALDGGADGLDFYRRYLADAFNLLKSGGGVLFEIGFDQGGAVAALMEEAGFTDVEISKDIAGLDRYASARLG
ncbi:MAG: peptide chain release factor N(5)-glutamine methyltransferase [Kiritimatiellae bacterium]|nr:peptide chain release factor N(5)-glutamine methyltransferase [Kiritimatiellia bacterium]